MVCEKPDAAARVARALDEEGMPRKHEAGRVVYFECRTRGETILVCSALGHLYAVSSKGKTGRQFYPVWDYGWKPKHEIERLSARLGKWISVITSLSRGVDRFVDATDFDIEGSVIGHSILQYACGNAHLQARRMKFSTMTEKELKGAFRNLSSQLDFSMVEAGRCRHELDWLYGINLSRLLTEAALKQGRGYATLSTGRVQGPTLKFAVEREEEIGYFVPVPYWTVEAAISHDGKEYQLEYAKERIPTLVEAESVVRDCRGGMLEVKDIESREVRQEPPYPFDLPSLQSEAYRHFGFTPSRTLAIAERLYLDALISYPRTSSQKLPPDIGYEEILRGIAGQPAYRSLTGKLVESVPLRPNEGPKFDPAHPAIYPTGEGPKRPLLGPEARLFDLIVRRFMSTFAQPSLRLSSRVVLELEAYRFFLRGSCFLKLGWVEFYRPYVSDELQEIPSVQVGMKVPIARIEALEKFTQPPPRYNPSSLLRKMEEENIGTKATRADIIETLYRRGYVRETRIQVTPLAVHITELLRKFCPLIIDPGFTAKLETLMEGIQQRTFTRREVIVETLEHLRPVMLDLISREEDIGTGLGELVSAQRASTVTFETPCPECGSVLKIVRNRKTGKRFVGCTGKWGKGCSFSLPLPQFGTLTILRTKCKVCGFQMIQARSRGRRPLYSCARCYASKTRRTTMEKAAPVSRAVSGLSRPT